MKITFVLHYSDQTQRLYYDEENFEFNGSAAGQTEIIKIDTYQKLNKSILDVLPAQWKRAFCNYTFHWDNEPLTTESNTTDKTVTTVNQEMVDAYNNDHHEYLFVHVTYDYTTGSPFNWSSQDAQSPEYHWYYLVNNHRPGNEQGKMVFRSTDPDLRVSEGLVDSKLYLSNYEWCVIGDPYGFKLLNRYDPDKKFSEYISVVDTKDVNNEGYRLQQVDNNDNCLFEMMPGMYDYNFWIHPIYSDVMLYDYTTGNYSYVGNNFNGSSAIIPDTKRSAAYLKSSGASNFRLEIQSDHTLSEYVKYAGFVGGLKYDKVTDAMRTDAADNDLTDEDKTAVRELIDNPDNIVQMTQGYYRIIPFTQESATEGHHYVLAYKDANQKAGTGGMSKNMLVEDQTAAESDAASIFWFEGTTHDGTTNGYPRYYVKAQDLFLTQNMLTDDEDKKKKVRYEDLGAAITQLKVDYLEGAQQPNYLSCSNADATTINQCFDEQGGVFKTRFYLQKVGTENPAEMPLKKQMVKGHDGNNGTQLRDGENNPWGKLPYTYWALYVPYDLEIVGGLDNAGNKVKPGDAGFDVMPFIGISERYHDKYTSGSDTYYNKGEYALFCESIDEHQKNPDWAVSNLYIPAGTPVMFRSLSGMQGITFTIPTTAPSTATEGMALTENQFKGTYLKVSNNNPKIRVFGKEWNNGAYTGRVGLFPRSSVETPLSSNNIYYVEPTRSQQSSAPGVLFSFSADDEATGLNGTPLQTMPDDDSLYDLQGRKVVGTARPGVYIRNGRKVVIK